MYFFSEVTLVGLTNASTPLGNWDVSGYERINVHVWAKGGAGTVYMESYFNGLSAYQERLTIVPSSFSWSVAILNKTYSVFAPTFGVVVSASTPVDLKLRLYAACCEAPRGGLIAKLMPARRAGQGEVYRKLNEPVDIDALMRAPDQAEAG